MPQIARFDLPRAFVARVLLSGVLLATFVLGLCVSLGPVRLDAPDIPREALRAGLLATLLLFLAGVGVAGGALARRRPVLAIHDEGLEVSVFPGLATIWLEWRDVGHVSWDGRALRIELVDLEAYLARHEVPQVMRWRLRLVGLELVPGWTIVPLGEIERLIAQHRPPSGVDGDATTPHDRPTRGTGPHGDPGLLRVRDGAERQARAGRQEGQVQDLRDRTQDPGPG